MNLYYIHLRPHSHRDTSHRVGQVRAATFKKAVDAAIEQKLCPPLLSEHPTYECRGLRKYVLEYQPGGPCAVYIHRVPNGAKYAAAILNAE